MKLATTITRATSLLVLVLAIHAQIAPPADVSATDTPIPGIAEPTLDATADTGTTETSLDDAPTTDAAATDTTSPEETLISSIPSSAQVTGVNTGVISKSISPTVVGSTLASVNTGVPGAVPVSARPGVSGSPGLAGTPVAPIASSTVPRPSLIPTGSPVAPTGGTTFNGGSPVTTLVTSSTTFMAIVVGAIFAAVL